jgi:hypothetical protein
MILIFTLPNAFILLRTDYGRLLSNTWLGEAISAPVCLSRLDVTPSVLYLAKLPVVQLQSRMGVLSTRIELHASESSCKCCL